MRHFFKKNGLVIAGGIIQGFGMGVFLFPHSIPSGGAGGLAVLLNYWVGIDMSIALWLVNFSLLAIAVRFLGNSTALWTMASITMTSLSVYFFQENLSIPERFVWTDILFGSLFLGAGVGILLREGVSNGGIGVVALIISNYRNTLPGKPLFWMNGVIFLLTASIINWQIIIQALLSQWISTKVVDLVCSADFYGTYTLGMRKK
ncbi:YitT family protein [Bacillus massilinigeriensis]|uniref:YitT family protein n=1 Tax=Bacillus mediterraneensis TaxID=1805474 RepID=UPI001F477FF6|nr:YitT family protein [Bacillus mediterraneensis]